ncbi:hypothetical protein ACQY0O_007383 [Thecaphora frezii]
MSDHAPSSPHPAPVAADAPSSHVRQPETRTLRNNVSVSTATSSSSSASSAGPKQRQLQPSRRIPVYVRIVQKDIWLRLHVHLNATIGSIKDLALQKANAPESDPTQSPYFYFDAVSVSAACKIVSSSSHQAFARFRPDLLPKSFVAACPRPAPMLPRVGSRSFEVSSLSSHAFTSGSPSASSSKPRWKDKVGVLHGGGTRASSAEPTTSEPPRRPATAPKNPALHDGDKGRTRQTPLHDVPEHEQAGAVAMANLAGGRKHKRAASFVHEHAANLDGDDLASARSQRQAFPSGDIVRPSTAVGFDAPSATMQLPLDPFVGGNAEAKEEEARALARLSGWSASVSIPGATSAGRRSIDGAISGLVSANGAISLAKSREEKVDHNRLDSFTDDGSASDDDLIGSSVSRSGLRGVLTCAEATRSSQSLAETVSSGSSVDILTTSEADGLWGTQLEEKLLSEQGTAAVSPGDGLVPSAPSLHDRSRSRTVTAADLMLAPELRGLALTAAASDDPAAHERISSLPTSSGPLRAAASREFTQEELAAAAALPPANSSGQSSPNLSSGVSAASPWLDRGKLAGINLDEMSRWRKAAHGSSDRFSLYSFSNGLLLEDWKTVAAYKLRPFELLEMQSSSPVERVHLTREVTGMVHEAIRQGRPCRSLDCPALEPYYEGWIYVLKPSSVSMRHAVKITIGTWKLRWITIRGWKMDVYRKKPKLGESTPPSSACYWHLSLIRWVTSEKIDPAVATVANPPLAALEHLPPCSLTVAFSSAGWSTAMPSEFTLPTSGSSITIRCATKHDHDALYNVLSRARFRSISRKTDQPDLLHLVDGWRCNAVLRATIAGRGGTVQPGRLARTKGGRNAMARTRLRPSGWPREWEDADEWSSSSEVEDVVLSELTWQGDPGAANKAADGRGSLDAERPTTGYSAHGLRAAFLQHQQHHYHSYQPQPQVQQTLTVTAKRSSSPLNPSTPPSTLGRRSKLSSQAIEAAAASPETPSKRGATAESVRGSPPSVSQVSPSRSRGFSLSRSARAKPSNMERTTSATSTGSRQDGALGSDLTRSATPKSTGASSSIDIAATASTTGSVGRSRAHTVSSASAAAASPPRASAMGAFPIAIPSTLRRSNSRRTSNELERSSRPTTSQRGSSGSSSGGAAAVPKQDVPISLFPANMGTVRTHEPTRSVALLKRFNKRSIVLPKEASSNSEANGDVHGPG